MPRRAALFASALAAHISKVKRMIPTGADTLSIALRPDGSANDVRVSVPLPEAKP